MGTVITQVDIMKYNGTSEAIFPIGTIVTPSARDWAKEHGINIVIDHMVDNTLKESKVQGEAGKSLLLKQVVKSVIGKAKMPGTSMEKEEIVRIVIACLKKIGCTIKE